MVKKVYIKFLFSFFSLVVYSRPPVVVTGPTSTGIDAKLTPPKEQTLPQNTLSSTLSITPTQSGHQHVCVQIQKDRNK
jgi:hypothetical protein